MTPASGAAAPVRLPVPMRPMTMPDLLDGSFAVIKARPKTVFTIAAAILIPFHLLSAFLQRGLTGFSLTTGFGQQGTTTASTASQVGALLLGYLGVALVTLAPFFLGGALAKVVAAWYAGSDLSAGDALRATWQRAPALVGAYLVLLPLKVLGLMACVVGVLPGHHAVRGDGAGHHHRGPRAHRRRPTLVAVGEPPVLAVPRRGPWWRRWAPTC